jgi:hypothetical protein
MHIAGNHSDDPEFTEQIQAYADVQIGAQISGSSASNCDVWANQCTDSSFASGAYASPTGGASGITAMHASVGYVEGHSAQIQFAYPGTPAGAMYFTNTGQAMASGTLVLVSLYARTDTPHRNVAFLYSLSYGNVSNWQFDITTTWKRFAFRCVVPPALGGTYYVAVNVPFDPASFSANVNLFIDDIQVEVSALRPHAYINTTASGMPGAPVYDQWVPAT